MTTDPITSAGVGAAAAPETKVAGAAKQFEALMIAQMLRTAREDTEDGNSSSSTMLDVADQQFSQVLANNGGLGLAKLIVKGLNQGQTNANQQSSPIE
ncbi:MAG TPA: rod-binding protein [Bryobacteraceae bacterium]|jgi:Rod binding domain-containing protein|nr:rod-binding protein [Bryobacteraceae bacterium]